MVAIERSVLDQVIGLREGAIRLRFVIGIQILRRLDRYRRSLLGDVLSLAMDLL